MMDFAICSTTLEPMHVCAREGDLEGLRRLLDRGSLIDVKGVCFQCFKIYLPFFCTCIYSKDLQIDDN